MGLVLKEHTLFTEASYNFSLLISQEHLIQLILYCVSTVFKEKYLRVQRGRGGEFLYRRWTSCKDKPCWSSPPPHGLFGVVTSRYIISVAHGVNQRPQCLIIALLPHSNLWASGYTVQLCSYVSASPPSLFPYVESCENKGECLQVC